MHIETYVEMICVYRYIDITYHTSPLVWLIYVPFLCLLADGKQKRLEHHCYHETLCAPILLVFTFLESKGPIESMLSGSSIWHHLALC